jgi:DNA-binding transcriptional regulator PaaX
MAKKADFSKKILNSLSGKKAVSIPDLRAVVSSTGSKQAKTGLPAQTYAVTRSLKNLADTGLIETLAAGQGEFARLTQKGRQKVAALKLDSRESLSNPNWDGKWRIVLLDLPEDRKSERESLRYLLKKAGFIRLKNSAWISPFPFEFLFQNIKKDFGFTTEVMIVVTESIDPETDADLRATYGMR